METIIERSVVLGDDTTSPGAGAVSWAAIFGGAATAAAMSLILFLLGIGLGLGAVSPWSEEGIGVGALGISTILWITFTSLVASGLGGYLTGRLRTRWVAVHSDEVYFRDTAHGFLAWAVATLLTAVIFTATTAGMASAGARAVAAVAGGAADAAATAAGSTAAAGAGMLAADAGEADPLAYHLEALFRTEDAAGAEAFPALEEVSRIFVRAIRNDQLPQEDLAYVGRQVARHTGVPVQEAGMRVSEMFETARAELRELEAGIRQAADDARAASAKVALWFFVALLAGAFTGSYAATIGGRQRDL